MLSNQWWAPSALNRFFHDKSAIVYGAYTPLPWHSAFQTKAMHQRTQIISWHQCSPRNDVTRIRRQVGLGLDHHICSSVCRIHWPSDTTSRYPNPLSCSQSACLMRFESSWKGSLRLHFNDKVWLIWNQALTWTNATWECGEDLEAYSGKRCISYIYIEIFPISPILDLREFLGNTPTTNSSQICPVLVFTLVSLT